MLESPWLLSSWQEIALTVEPAWTAVSAYLDRVPTFLKESAALWVIAIGTPLLAGLFSKRSVLRADEDDSDKLQIKAAEKGDLAKPEPSDHGEIAWTSLDGVWH